MNSTSRELADKIITLDGSINKNFQKLGYIYFALKSLKNNLPENNELNDKLLFLKSYLYRNIISYKQYNLSYDLLKLSKRKIPEQDEITQYLKSYVSGVTDALNLIALPSLKIKSSYALNLKNDSDEKVQQIANFIKTIPDFYKITDIKKQMSLFVGNSQSLTIKIDDDKEQTIQNDLSAIKSDISDIKSFFNYLTSQNQFAESKKFSKKIAYSRINCKKALKDIILLFEMLESKKIVKFVDRSNVDIIINLHFEFENKEKCNQHEITLIEKKKIIWLTSQRLLIYFIEQLKERDVISFPPTYKVSRLIITHFCDENGENYKLSSISDQQKKMKNNKKSKIGEIGKPEGFEIIDSLIQPIVI